LEVYKNLEVENIRVFSDLQLMACLFKGMFETKGNQRVKYLAKVKKSIEDFLNLEIIHKAKSDSHQVDASSKLANST